MGKEGRGDGDEREGEPAPHPGLHGAPAGTQGGMKPPLRINANSGQHGVSEMQEYCLHARMGGYFVLEFELDASISNVIHCLTLLDYKQRSTIWQKRQPLACV